MVKKRTLQGDDVPKLHITETFIEFYRLELTLNQLTQNYVIIRLVTIIEQFCRDVMINKLRNSGTSLDTIELKIPFIDNLIRAVSVEHRHIYRRDKV